VAVETKRFQITSGEIYALGWRGAFRSWGQETNVPSYPTKEPLEVLRDRIYVPPEISGPSDLSKFLPAWPRAKNLLDVVGRITNERSNSGWREIEFSKDFTGATWSEQKFKKEQIARGRVGLTVNELVFFLEYRKLINKPVQGTWISVLESKKDGLPLFVYPYPNGDLAMTASRLTVKDSFFHFVVPTSRSVVLDKET
jgi:hypothetical protein